MLDKIIFVALCFLIFILPIPLGSYRPWAVMFVCSVVCIGFIAHLINHITQKKPLIEIKKIGPLFLALSIVVSVLFIQISPVLPSSVDAYQTKLMLYKTLSMCFFVALIASYINSSYRLKIFLASMVAAGLIQALYATYLNLNPDSASLIFESAHTDRARGSFTYQNFLANYLALTLSMGIALLINELKITSNNLTFKQVLRDLTETCLSNKMFLRVSLILIIVGLILTRSRMGNSAFFISLAVVSLFAFFFYKRRPKYLRALIISFFILDLVLIGAMFGVEKVKQRLVETSLSSETRDEVVRDSLTLISEKPLLGHGGGSFYTAFPKVKPEPYTGYYDNAHNDYIQFSVEIGVVATGVLGLCLIYALFICGKIMIKRNNQLHQSIAFGCSVAIIHMLLHSTVDYSLQAGANSFTFIAILALVFIINAMPEKGKRRYRRT